MKPFAQSSPKPRNPADCARRTRIGVHVCIALACLGLASSSSYAFDASASRIVLEVPPGTNNPRNSEGSFIDLSDGRILFIYSRFEGNDHNDHAKAALSARYSSDSGLTWTDDSAVETPGEQHAMNVMSVSLLRLNNGDLGLFYMLRNSWHDLRMYLRRSSDDARTWSAPVACMAAKEYYVVNNDRVVRLSTGRLIIPAAWHRKLSEENDEASLDWHGISTFFLSDDDGVTWRESETFCALHNDHTSSGLQEPGVVELPNGVIWGWARTDLGRQYEFFSWDSGEHWSKPAPSRFASPLSPLSMKRLPGSHRMLAVWNPIPNYPTRTLEPPAGDRTPLAAAIGGGTLDATWGSAVVVDENSPSHEGYSYTAIHFIKESVLLAYSAGGIPDGHRLNRLRIRRLNLKALGDTPNSP